MAVGVTALFDTARAVLQPPGQQRCHWLGSGLFGCHLGATTAMASGPATAQLVGSCARLMLQVLPAQVPAPQVTVGLLGRAMAVCWQPLPLAAMVQLSNVQALASSQGSTGPSWHWPPLQKSPVVDGRGVVTAGLQWSGYGTLAHSRQAQAVPTAVHTQLGHIFTTGLTGPVVGLTVVPVVLQRAPRSSLQTKLPSRPRSDRPIHAATSPQLVVATALAVLFS